MLHWRAECPGLGDGLIRGAIDPNARLAFDVLTWFYLEAVPKSGRPRASR